MLMLSYPDRLSGYLGSAHERMTHNRSIGKVTACPRSPQPEALDCERTSCMRRKASGRARDGTAAVDLRGHAADGPIRVIGQESARGERDEHPLASSRPARRVRRDEARNGLSRGALNGDLVRDGRVMVDAVPISIVLAPRSSASRS